MTMTIRNFGSGLVSRRLNNRVSKVIWLRRTLVEDVETGTSLVQELREGRISRIVAVKPEARRGQPHGSRLGKFESGEVYLPTRAPWLADFERKLFAFRASNLTINAIRSAKRYQGRTIDCRCASRMRCSMLQIGLTLGF